MLTIRLIELNYQLVFNFKDSNIVRVDTNNKFRKNNLV